MDLAIVNRGFACALLPIVVFSNRRVRRKNVSGTCIGHIADKFRSPNQVCVELHFPGRHEAM